ncbi:MAG: hypothetical protein H0U74_24080 [Bradymonadaceae bacterium]|nr:hypothetical protein [Lujinxingiaceae bacterium]
MEYYLETRDHCARRFWRVTADKTCCTVAQGPVGGVGIEEMFNFASSELAQEAAERMAIERLAQGYFEMLPPDERFLQDLPIADYFDTQFFDDLGLATPRARGGSDELALLERYHGVELPPELRIFIAARDTFVIHEAQLGQWVLSDELWLPRQAQGNLFEQLIWRSQSAGDATAILEYMVSLVPLGSTHEGDRFFAQIDAVDPDNTEIFFWERATHDLPFAIADSLSSLAFLNRLFEDLTSGARGVDTICDDLELLLDRVTLAAPFHALDALIEDDFEYAWRFNADTLYYRSLWITKLLCCDPASFEVQSVGEVFIDQLQRQYAFENTLTSNYLTTTTPTPLYWLWRLFFFNRDAQLRHCISIAREHQSPLVRDAAALVEALQNGQRRLGHIEDIHALRTQFLALDLDCERA